MRKSGRSQRQKGDRVERKIRKLIEEIGLPCSRVPLSGSAGGLFAGDLKVDGLNVEVKSRKNGWPRLERWLGNSDGTVVLHRDCLPEERGRPVHRRVMVLLTFEMWVLLMAHRLKD